MVFKRFQTTLFLNQTRIRIYRAKTTDEIDKIYDTGMNRIQKDKTEDLEYNEEQFAKKKMNFDKQLRVIEKKLITLQEDKKNTVEELKELSTTTKDSKAKIEEDFKTNKKLLDDSKDNALTGLSSSPKNWLAPKNWLGNIFDKFIDTPIGGTRKFKKRRPTKSRRSKVKRS